jgi:hypothetical protein
MYSQIVIVALSGYPPGVNKLYCIVLYCNGPCNVASNPTFAQSRKRLRKEKLRSGVGVCTGPTYFDGMTISVPGLGQKQSVLALHC